MRLVVLSLALFAAVASARPGKWEFWAIGMSSRIFSCCVILVFFSATSVLVNECFGALSRRRGALIPLALSQERCGTSRDRASMREQSRNRAWASRERSPPSAEKRTKPQPSRREGERDESAPFFFGSCRLSLSNSWDPFFTFLLFLSSSSLKALSQSLVLFLSQRLSFGASRGKRLGEFHSS